MTILQNKGVIMSEFAVKISGINKSFKKNQPILKEINLNNDVSRTTNL